MGKRYRYVGRSVEEIDRDRRIGARLREARVITGMTLAALGRMAGVTFQQMQKYESGKNRIAVSRLETFAKALDLPVTWFFDEAVGGDSGDLTVFSGLNATMGHLGWLRDNRPNVFKALTTFIGQMVVETSHRHI